ncbi:MAG: hypothetical protein KF878_34440 [Planctomycetes bacterium]|nr:hypothetical protein [Planctomycetota bacterium]
MAIKNRCVACDFVIEGDDAMRGREVVCPKCETLNVMRSAEDAARMREDDQVQLDHERRRFLERLARPGAASAGSASSAAPAAWSPPDDAARGLAVLAARRLKDVSVYVLAVAYLVLVLAFVIAGLLVIGTELPPIWKAFGFLAGATAGVVVFVVLKFTSDAVRALADVTDLLRSLDVRLERLEEVQAALAPEGLIASGGPE